MADHRECVSAFLERAGDRLPPERFLESFVEAFNDVWGRARTTLGDVTLLAIGRRVLHKTVERHPALLGLAVAADGIALGTVDPDQADADALVPAARFMLEEFLTVMGRLTAEILTPALHQVLSRAAAPGPDETHPRRPRNAP
ncbi:MAG: hypothetical protein JWM80_2161 [Cyanobacteria bacterium RYN_339]|nr:hypothetical protein [Cyanobacteria bacterium RYN_339]